MIVYGSGSGVAVLGDFGEHQCPSCGQLSRFSAMVNYKYSHIWYLFSFLTGRDYYLLCNNCQNGTKLDKAQVKQQFPKDNIPFIRKRGWLLCLALAGLFIVWMGIGSRANAQKVAGYFAAPQVRDIYLTNLALVEGSGFGHVTTAYGAMRLESMDGDEMVFSTTNGAFDRKSDFANKLRNNSQEARFDAENPVVLTKEQVQDLYKREIIHDIQRP